jgi:hypothetical protein
VVIPEPRDFVKVRLQTVNYKAQAWTGKEWQDIPVDIFEQTYQGWLMQSQDQVMFLTSNATIFKITKIDPS